YFFFFSSRRRHTRFSRDWSSDVCSSDLAGEKDSLDFTAIDFGRGIGNNKNPQCCGKAGRKNFIDDGPAVSIATPYDFKRRLGRRSEERRVGKECSSWWSRYA